MPALKGTLTALVTPFDENNQLDEIGLRHLLRLQIESHVDGIVCLGTTGEAPTLSDDEQKQVITIARKEIDKPIKLVVGTGCYSTAQTIKYTRQAEHFGADMALVVSPYYNKPTQEGLYRHFQAVAKESHIPIILYNHPGRTGVNIHLETLKRLMEIPNIIGIKDCSANINFISEIVETAWHTRPEFSIMSGDDSITLPLMALGGHGVISVVSNLVPKIVKKLTDAMQDGNIATAREMHFHLMPLFNASNIEINPIPIKALLKCASLPAGECRLPLCALSPKNAAHIEEMVRHYAEHIVSPASV